MVWLVIAIPLATVLAGLATLGLALNGPHADVVPDLVRQSAQVQVTDLAADRAAARLNLRGELRAHGMPGRLSLRLRGSTTTLDTDLSLRLIHPLRASADRAIVLRREAEGWHGWWPAPGPALPYIVQVAAADRRWVLFGEWDPARQRALLAPRIAR